MPTGWRPLDIAEKYPVYKISDVYHFEKYSPASSKKLYAWSWIQLIMVLLFVSYLFGNIASIGNPKIFIYGAFVFLHVYAYCELMDRHRFSLVWELLKNAFGLSVIFYHGSWFGAENFTPWINITLISYFILSPLITAWFVFDDFKKPLPTQIVH